MRYDNITRAVFLKRSNRFIAEVDGVSVVMPNTSTHAEFGTALDEAMAAGVEVWFLKCHVEPVERKL